jgi:hypothetical protein
MSLAIDRTVACDRLDQKHPIARSAIQHNIRHLAVDFNFHTEPCKKQRVEVTPLFARVPCVDQDCAGCKACGEVFYYSPDQFTMLARAEIDPFPRGNLDGHKVLDSFLCVAFGQALMLCEIRRESVVPCRPIECAKQGKYLRRNLIYGGGAVHRTSGVVRVI